MENSGLGVRILMEMESLIFRSCNERKRSDAFVKLHTDLVARYYNAENVSIDYHRQRVSMDVAQNDTGYNENSNDTTETLLRLNLRYDNLADFLRSCLDNDSESLAFYMRILRSQPQNEMPLITV